MSSSLPCLFTFIVYTYVSPLVHRFASEQPIRMIIVPTADATHVESAESPLTRIRRVPTVRDTPGRRGSPTTNGLGVSTPLGLSVRSLHVLPVSATV